MSEIEDLSDRTAPWAEKYATARSGIHKQIIYHVARPWLDHRARRHLSPDTLRSLPACRVLGERGFPLEARRRWVRKAARVRGSRMLVAGTGSGWDVASWLAMKPALILGLDRYSFSASWAEVGWHARQCGSTITGFVQGSLEGLPVASQSLDLIASDAVLEHCTDLRGFLREAFRVLRPGGAFYASYGPLWPCWGGDHFSGTARQDEGYSHLELDPDDYARFVDQHPGFDGDAQTGRRYVELDLFSKLTSDGYLAAFAEAGFQIADLIVEVSGAAIAFRASWPERLRAIAQRNALREDDLIIKSHLVLLIKPRAHS